MNDPTVTNVLLLLNPAYKEKVDNRIGGVGYEGMIISAEIFTKTEQTKYVPIVFENEGRDNKEVIPTFLSSKVYHDLSNDDELAFKKLIKILYGKPEDIKPLLGEKPSWVDKPLEGISTNPKVKKNFLLLLMKVIK